MALKNDVHYHHQDENIQDALEDYEKLSEDTSINSGRGSNIAQKEAARISKKIQLENAYSSVRKAVLTKADLKRASYSDTANAFYAVIEAQNSLASALTDLELKRQELKKAEIKYMLNIVPKKTLTQAEEACKNSEAAYNKAALELENCISKLCKIIGRKLDMSKVKLDTTLDIPDIKSIELEKIKEDNLKDNLSYFSAREQYKLAEYQLALTEEKYEDYFDELKRGSPSVREEFDNMLFDAQKSSKMLSTAGMKSLRNWRSPLETSMTVLKTFMKAILSKKKILTI